MNRNGYSYAVEYRLDDLENYDSTEFIDDIDTIAEARKLAREIKKENKGRVVMLDIKKYDEDGYLVDAITLI